MISSWSHHRARSGQEQGSLAPIPLLVLWGKSSERRAWIRKCRYLRWAPQKQSLHRGSLFRWFTGRGSEKGSEGMHNRERGKSYIQRWSQLGSSHSLVPLRVLEHDQHHRVSLTWKSVVPSCTTTSASHWPPSAQLLWPPGWAALIGLRSPLQGRGSCEPSAATLRQLGDAPAG